MEISKALFGTDKEGKDVYKYLVCGENIEATFCDTGASMMSIVVKDKNGEKRDILLGLSEYIDYQNNWPAFGSVIGRCANRIGGAKFELNGETYNLKKDMTGKVCLHSGYSYHFRDFFSESFMENNEAHIIFTLVSEDGDQGFPGKLTLKVEYVVSEDSSITINYKAVASKDTIVNVTNHAYFNLNGHADGTALNHKLKIFADSLTQFDKHLLPTGNIMKVENTAYDFRELTVINDNMKKPFKPLSQQKEYDINYVISGEPLEYKQAVHLIGDKSGISMKVFTDMPGMQFYTANAVKRYKAKGGIRYAENPGLCFETQYFPDAINRPEFISPILKAGEEMNSKTRFEFSVE